MLDLAIGIGGQLLGGLFGNRRAKKAAAAEAARAAQERAWAIEDQAEQFVRLRDAAEKAGFNPLTALGAAPGSGMVGATAAAGPVSSQDYMGSAIADSALMLADSLAKTKAAAMGQKVQMLARQNRRISGQLTQATLRPKVGGVYDGARTFGTGAANVGSRNSNSAGAGVSRASVGRGDSHLAGVAHLPALPDVEAVDPRREVTHKPVATHPGVIIADNPYLGRYYFPTADGEEILGGDLMGLAWAAHQIPLNFGHSMTMGGGRESRPRLSRQEALRLKAQREKAAPNYPVGREFFTHQFTGFSAPRQRWGY